MFQEKNAESWCTKILQPYVTVLQNVQKEIVYVTKANV